MYRGNKLKKEVNETGQPLKTTLYVAGAVYENDVLQFIAHEEGRVRKSGTAYVYDYFFPAQSLTAELCAVADSGRCTNIICIFISCKAISKKDNLIECFLFSFLPRVSLRSFVRRGLWAMQHNWYFYDVPVRRDIPYNEGLYFITFTCHQWLPLIDYTNSYDVVYRWFDYLKTKNHDIIGYVIMPNHLHVMISFSKTEKSINKIIGDGKRFIAYEIIKRLEQKRIKAYTEKTDECCVCN